MDSDKLQILKNIIPGEGLDDTVFNYSRRISFSKLGFEGLEDMHEYSSMPELYKYLEGRKPSRTINETRDYLNLLMDRVKNGSHGGRCMYWFIRLKSSNKVIGTFGLVGIDFKKRTAKIGKALSPNFWGSGLMLEALWTVSHYCFEDLGLEEIETSTHYKNYANLQLMKSIGSSDQQQNLLIAPNGKKVKTIQLTLKKSNVKYNRCLAFAKIGSD